MAWLRAVCKTFQKSAVLHKSRVQLIFRDPAASSSRLDQMSVRRRQRKGRRDSFALCSCPLSPATPTFSKTCLCAFSHKVGTKHYLTREKMRLCSASWAITLVCLAHSANALCPENQECCLCSGTGWTRKVCVPRPHGQSTQEEACGKAGFNLSCTPATGCNGGGKKL